MREAVIDWERESMREAVRDWERETEIERGVCEMLSWRICVLAAVQMIEM